MGKVAAVQMTSSHIVADNLAFAAARLREAKDAGAEVACLPENFSFIGLKDADKLQVAENFGDGLVQAFLSATATNSACGFWAAPLSFAPAMATRVANSLAAVRRSRQARRPLPDKIHLFDVTIPGRDEQYRRCDACVAGPRSRSSPTHRSAGSAFSVCYDLYAVSPSCIENWYLRAPSGWRCPLRSRFPRAERIGRRCCARAPSRTCATWWPPPR